MQKAIYEELSDIYKGLYRQRQAATCTDSSDKAIFLRQAKKCLKAATLYNAPADLKFVEIRDRDNRIGNLLSIFTMYKSSLEDDSLWKDATKVNEVEIRLNSWDLFKHLHSVIVKIHSHYFNGSTELAKESDDDRDKKMTMIMGKENLIKTYQKMECSVDQMTYTKVRQYKTNPGYSPTVHASWFLAQAYLANLFYTQDHDDTATVAACDELLRVCRLSLYNDRFAERLFPVLISSDWVKIFDEHLQAFLGFYTLFAFLTKSNESRSVCLGFCPVSFVLYLKICVAFRRQDNVEDIILKLVEERNEHCAHSCECDILNNGGHFLTAAICVMLKRLGLVEKTDPVALLK